VPAAKHPDYVCKLHKSIYGRKQSPRAWYSRLSDRLHQFGFTAAKSDSSLFVFSQDGITIYMLVYVDDIIFASSCSRASACLIQLLGTSFPVKDLGPLHFFLGIEAVRDPGGMSLSQSKYAMDLLCFTALTWTTASQSLCRCLSKTSCLQFRALH